MALKYWLVAIVAGMLMIPRGVSAEEVAPSANAETGAPTWTGDDWAILVGSAALGELAGGIGAVALYWRLTGVCGERDIDGCFAGHRPSSLAIGLAMGAPLGAGLTTVFVGAALGFDGSPLAAIGGALVGLAMFGTVFSPYGDLGEMTVPVGTALALLSMPWTSVLLYYASQDHPHPIGAGASLLTVSPEAGLMWGTPTLGVVPTPEGLAVSVPLLGGRF